MMFKNEKTGWKLFGLTASIMIFMALLQLLTGGCASTQGVASKTPSTASKGKGGAELWADNCERCHNIRSPTSHNDAEWELLVHHMRVRANITGEDSRKIIEFLKSADKSADTPGK